MDSSSLQWQKMATVEVSSDASRLADFLGRDFALNFRLEPAEQSPVGYHRYDLLVDTRDGERRRARTAWAILTALKNIAAANLVQGFRIIDGSQWLTMGDNNAAMGVDGMTAGNI